MTELRFAKKYCKRLRQTKIEASDLLVNIHKHIQECSPHHSTNLFLFSSLPCSHQYRSSIFCRCKHTHNPQFLNSFWRRANASNVSFRNSSLYQSIYIIKSVDKTKLSCYTFQRHSTAVSSETYPPLFISHDWFFSLASDCIWSSTVSFTLSIQLI